MGGNREAARSHWTASALGTGGNVSEEAGRDSSNEEGERVAIVSAKVEGRCAGIAVGKGGEARACRLVRAVVADCSPNCMVRMDGETLCIGVVMGEEDTIVLTLL